MSSEVMQAVTGHRFQGSECILNNYERFCVKDADYPGIKGNQGTSVEGLLYQDIPTEIWALLDDFEGELYQRIEVKITRLNQTEQPAFTYVIKEQYFHMLTQDPWSFNTFLQHGKKRFFNDCL